jgi:hypothetical protein
MLPQKVSLFEEEMKQLQYRIVVLTQISDWLLNIARRVEQSEVSAETKKR